MEPECTPDRSLAQLPSKGGCSWAALICMKLGGPGWGFAFQEAQWQRAGVEKPGAIPFGSWMGQDSIETEKMED